MTLTTTIVGGSLENCKLGFNVTVCYCIHSYLFFKTLYTLSTENYEVDIVLKNVRKQPGCFFGIHAEH